MSVVSRGVRNAFRNSIRTVSIVIILSLSIGLALTMLVARQAVQAKIDSVKSSIGNTITVSPAGARGFEGGGEPLTVDQINKVKALPHVVGATETLQDRLTAGTDTTLASAIDAGTLGQRQQQRSGGTGRGAGFTPPIMVIGTNNTVSLAAFAGGGTLSLSSGQAFDPAVDAPVALIGSGLATKNNLSVGSTFTAYSTKITVGGIFDSGNRFSNSVVVMPLGTVQRLSAQVGDLSNAIIQVDSISNLDATTASIKSTLGDAVDVVSQQDSSNQALAPLENIKNISLYSLVGAVIAGAIIILLTMMMIVRERRREIGVLKAIGSSNLKVMLQFMTEAITFTGLGAVVGLVIGFFAASPVTRVLVTSSSNASGGGQPGGGGGGGRFARFAGQQGTNLRNINAVVNWHILLYGLGAAVIIAVLGSAIPAWLISKVRPAEVMRAE